VFWVILGFCTLIAIIGIIGLALLPSNEGAKLTSMFSRNHIIQMCVGFVFNVFFFYFTANYFFNFIAEKKKFFSYFKVAIVAIIACFAYHLILDYVVPTKKPGEYATKGLLLFDVLLNSLFALGVSLLVAYLTNLRDGQKQRKILEAQKMQLEVEKTQANFNFLKAQINPHFLHNTLNFLYAKSLPYSAELSEGILTLSDIMRYALSEVNEKDGKAPLKDEIEHVQNVIKISQLRFSNKLNVNFEVTGVVNGAMIIPFVLITLVENAFKHGDLKSMEAPIDIKLNVNGNKLCFYCRNKKKSGPKELSTGIGLANIRNRLDLAYGNKYNFVVKEEPEFYTTELTISEL
jgi:LytS/YehU family sensor histidine kinase